MRESTPFPLFFGLPPLMNCLARSLAFSLSHLSLSRSRTRMIVFSSVFVCVFVVFSPSLQNMIDFISHHAPPPLTTNGLSNIPVSFDTRVFVSLSTRGKSAPTGGRDGKIPPAYCVRVRHLVTRLNTSKNDKLRRYTVNLFRRSIFEFQSKI